MMNPIDTGDTAWILVCCSLVLLMTPSLALFYGGMVRRKNVLSTLTLSYIFMAVIGVQWVLYGYSLAFGADIGGLIGGLNYLGLTGVDALPNENYARTLPHGLFAAFQMMFAVITPALITGAFVERVKFKAFLLFSLLWATLVYDPLCHWVWGQGGWLKQMGVLDFAGGTVVHIAAGFSALAFALVIGPRKGFGRSPMEPGNIPLTVIGAGLLWVGWFGFNAGSALAANGVAVNALLTTNTSAATAGLVWMLLSWLDGRPSTLGIATGMVVGLAAVTPASGYVTPMAAMLIGAVAAPLSYSTMRFRERRRLDESLDVWACHGISSTWGMLATGLFATIAVNGDGANGLFFGNPAQVGTQLVAIGVTIIFSFAATYVLARLLHASIGLRVSAAEEEVGLDISSHGERSYS
ncbi:MAG: ammonium transporter [Syntrophales bacterium]|jgi:Amt family ammonium transporter|nr:ammonium transporter [Syntrophales bacterium]MDD4338790.1 ammonium transporter [Syntrophales bacterium]HOG07349.1 ammonium transporter [Syntrophales bacterium]HOS76705.1 ammonium transporter [Syntrophales bacterium]HPB70105.1 ammonium transporter [Syntrophales bacterium]